MKGHKIVLRFTAKGMPSFFNQFTGIIGAMVIIVLFLNPAMGQEKDLDVPYASTPPDVVEKMLDMADVGPGDYVIDLGCGDGRIVTAAARRGAFGHGVDLDPKRLKEAREKARKANVSERVMFVQEDIFKTDIQQASVITMYLLSTVNEDMRPRLISELKPGTRIVSHQFGMGIWDPDKHIILGDSYMKGESLTLKEQIEKINHEIYYWVVPAQIEGQWKWRLNGNEFTMNVQQNFQKFQANIISGQDTLVVDNKKLVGKKISFTASSPGKKMHYAFNGKIDEDRQIKGTIQIHDPDARSIKKWEARFVK